MVKDVDRVGVKEEVTEVVHVEESEEPWEGEGGAVREAQVEEEAEGERDIEWVTELVADTLEQPVGEREKEGEGEDVTHTE